MKEIPRKIALQYFKCNTEIFLKRSSMNKTVEVSDFARNHGKLGYKQWKRV